MFLKRNFENRPTGPPSAAAGAAADAPRAAEGVPVGRFSKFLFEKVHIGMYYVHTKNIGRSLYTAAATAETAVQPPGPPNSHLLADFQFFFLMYIMS